MRWATYRSRPTDTFQYHLLEFILRFNILFLLWFYPIVYIIVAVGVIFFIAKFFESRADLLSALKSGIQHVLAEAREK